MARYRAEKTVRLFVQGEADFQHHLVAFNLALRDMTAHFSDFEPSDVMHGFGGPRNGPLNGIFNTFGAGADHLGHLVDSIFHVAFSCRIGLLSQRSRVPSVAEKQPPGRSEESRVGKEGGRKGRSR